MGGCLVGFGVVVCVMMLGRFVLNWELAGSVYSSVAMGLSQDCNLMNIICLEILAYMYVLVTSI